MDELGGSAVVVCAPAVFGAIWWPPRLGLAVVLSAAPIQAGYRRAKAKIDAAIGAILVVLGVRLALSR